MVKDPVHGKAGLLMPYKGASQGEWSHSEGEKKIYGEKEDFELGEVEHQGENNKFGSALVGEEAVIKVDLVNQDAKKTLSNRKEDSKQGKIEGHKVKAPILRQETYGRNAFEIKKPFMLGRVQKYSNDRRAGEDRGDSVRRMQRNGKSAGAPPPRLRCACRRMPYVGAFPWSADRHPQGCRSHRTG